MMRKVLIIAEAGVNHNGDLEKALQLVDAAADAGVDYVKFQTFKAEQLVTPDAAKAAYQTQNMGSGSTQFEMLKALELSDADHQAIMAHCRKRNIRFLSTAFDLESVEYLDSLGIDLFKVPSGEVTNYPYLRSIGGKRKPIILSTGMCDIDEIGEALNVLQEAGASLGDITVLHCNTEYPTPFGDVNLHAMNAIGRQFGVPVGYSDHTLGIEVPIAAVALGAVVIEKHFTLDRTLPGPDHAASLEPRELREMVRCIRHVEQAVGGSGIKTPSASERKNRTAARKSIHVARDLKANAVISEDDIVALRPGDGISPMQWKSVIGRRLVVEKSKFEKLRPEDFV